MTSNREEVESIPEEPKSPKKEKKKEKVPKKEKILKKESVKSMSILSFLKHTKKLEVPPVLIDLCDADPEEKEEGDPTIKTEATSIDVIKEASSSPQSIEELRAELKEQMDKEHQESMKRLEALHQHAKEIVIMREEKTEPGTHPGESQSGQGAQIHSTQSQSLPSEEPSQEDEAVIEMANEFEEDAIGGCDTSDVYRFNTTYQTHHSHNQQIRLTSIRAYPTPSYAWFSLYPPRY